MELAKFKEIAELFNSSKGFGSDVQNSMFHDLNLEVDDCGTRFKCVDTNRVHKVVSFFEKIHNFQSASSEDTEDWLSPYVNEAHPIETQDHLTYSVAMDLVGVRKSKGSLVELVNYLLASLFKNDTVKQTFIKAKNEYETKHVR